VIPFRVSFAPGTPLYEQVVYAAKKAVVSAQLRVGDPFPSVRELSKTFKINPNTAHRVVTQLVTEGIRPNAPRVFLPLPAHRVVTQLVTEGILEVHLGVGTVVTKRTGSSAAERSKLLQKEFEQLIVEAKRLGLTFEDVTSAAAQHWKRLDGSKK